MTAYVYMLTNRIRGTLYVGVTTSLVERIAAHKDGRGSDFARRSGCTRLVWYAEFEDIAAAIAHEKRLKKWRREWKIELVEEFNPRWEDLYRTLAGL